MGLGFFLRIQNLADLAPFKDEFSHIFSTKSLFLGGETYESRGYFINYINLLVLKLAGISPDNLANNYQGSLFWMRFPSVIMGVLTIPVFYFLGKSFNPKVGIIAAFLIAVFPLHIAMSKFIREYVYFFFLLSLDALILQKIITDFKNGIFKKIYLAGIIFIFLQIIDAFLIEIDSTLKSIVFLIFSFLLVIAFLVFKQYKKEILQKKSLLTGVLIIIFSLATSLFYKFSLFLTLTINSSYLEKMLFASEINYFNSFFGVFPVLLILSAGIFYALKKKRAEISFYIIFLLSSLVFFGFIFNRYTQIRYAYFYYIPYVMLSSIGIYMLGNFFKKHFNLPTIIAFIFSLSLVISPYNVVYSAYFKENDKWSNIGE